MLKIAIREEYLKKRLSLSNQEIDEFTSLISLQFSTISFPSISNLLSYYPLPEKNEFDVEKCDRAVIEKFPLVQIAWPRIENETTGMEAYILKPGGMYAKNRYNILEPLNGDPLPPENIDMVFVPLVAFSLKGFRVGYGKGFYDRFLVRCRPDVLKIGFSFFEPVLSIRNISQFDVPLNLCITPSRIYEF